MKRTYGILLLSTAVLLGGCASMHVKRGNKKFNAEAYSEAATSYKRALDKKDIPEAKIQLAHTYRLLNNPQLAEQYYRDAVVLPESEPINQFYFGRALMQNRKYAEAKKAFEEYLKSNPDDKVAKNMLYASENYALYEKGLDTCAYSLRKIELSGFANGYGASPFNFGYVFSAPSADLARKTDRYTGGNYLDLYFTKKDQNSGKWSAPEALKGGVNSEYHDGFATFSADGQTMYFTRSNQKKGKPAKNDKSEVTLKILKATFLDGEWTNIEEFPYNDESYSNAHPSLSRDGKTLYFTSDRPGGYGATDIYMCTWNGTGWGEPVNLGPTVNTAAREGYPMISFNEKLYFSSEGHPGLGGLDVFVTTRNGSSWSEPENLKAPVNSSMDDFSFSLNDEGKLGNVSSTRFGAASELAGNDNMYEVVYKDPIVSVQVCVRNKETNKPVGGITVKAINKATAEEVTAVSNDQGLATLRLKGESEFTINASTTEAVTNSIDASTVGKSCMDIVETCSTPVLIEPISGDPSQEFSVGDIYYDFNKWDIRPDAMPNLDKLVKMLTDNPTFTVEMGSHTDCRGTDAYNQRLSENRAKSVVRYCTLRDINPKRLQYKGYGESQPIEKCVCEECSEEQHQRNRRTTFRIITNK